MAKISALAPYVGAKSFLAPIVCEKIYQTKHKTYVEVFVGLGGIFFKKDLQSKIEVVNDFNSDITNLFRVTSRHLSALKDSFKYLLTSREEFERFIDTDSRLLTDIERAAQFLYLQRLRFRGLLKSKTFRASNQTRELFDKGGLEDNLNFCFQRLRGVVIENLDFEKLIKLYDNNDTLFYLDPPYFIKGNFYNEFDFSENDYLRLEKSLSSISGKFLLSLNNVDFIKDLFKSYNVEEVDVSYKIRRNREMTSELLISNF